MASNAETSIADTVARVQRIAAALMGLQAAEQRPTTEPNTTSVYVFNSGTESVTVIEVPAGSDKSGPLPASKASIDAMPRFAVTEDRVNDCAICLDEIGLGGEIREMPCKHGFHSDCIEKWLGIHGSCPVCRHMMPVEDGDGDDAGDDDGSEEGRRQRRRIISVSYVIIDRGGRSESAGTDQVLERGSEDSDPSNSRGSNGSESPPSGGDAVDCSSATQN